MCPCLSLGRWVRIEFLAGLRNLVTLGWSVCISFPLWNVILVFLPQSRCNLSSVCKNHAPMAATPELERRRLQRVPLEGRVRGRWKNGGVHELHGVSKNVSAEGMYLLIDTDVEEGAQVELILDLPSHHVFRGAVTLRCVGRVVRREELTDSGEHGIAVVFDNVEIVTKN